MPGMCTDERGDTGGLAAVLERERAMLDETERTKGRRQREGP
jgi:hypothetical protein